MSVVIDLSDLHLLILSTTKSSTICSRFNFSACSFSKNNITVHSTSLSHYTPKSCHFQLNQCSAIKIVTWIDSQKQQKCLTHLIEGTFLFPLQNQYWRIHHEHFSIQNLCTNRSTSHIFILYLDHLACLLCNNCQPWLGCNHSPFTP